MVRSGWYACGIASKKGSGKRNADPQSADFQGDFAETGTFVYTYALRLPFRLGISDNFEQEIAWPGEYQSAEDAQAFAKPPFVRLRLFNAAIPDRKFSPANAAAAVRQFYDYDYELGPADDVDPHLYEQWVSLETPAALLVGEDSKDGAFAFHRCLFALNVYLQAFALARNDNLVRSISSRELRPIVIVGQLSLSGKWTLRGPILMHPDAKARSLSSRSTAEHAQSLNRALDAMVRENPFVQSQQWKGRAERRRYEGDNADAVVSFQIAAEALMFAIWSLLLIDEGHSTAEILNLRQNTPFATLVKSELGQRLGGSWDTTRTRTPIGRYWSDVYQLRIQVTHAGYLPNDGDAEIAESAFEDLEKFLDGRLEKKAKRYPSALAARREVTEAIRTSS